MSKLLFLLAFVFSSISLFPLCFSGKVIEEGTNKYLSNVKLNVIGMTKTVFSDQNGNYAITGLEPGKYRIRVINQGFIPRTIDIEISKDISEEIGLERDFLLLYEITVTPTKTEKFLGEAPVSSEILTKTEIKNKGIKETKDLFDTFSGLNVNRTSGSWGNKANISIQGMDARHTLILVDGQKYTGGHGAVDLASIPVEIIERVEVVKGPSSALYGSDAIGGVVNIITTSPFERKPQLNLNAAFGSENLKLYELGANLSREKLGTSINVSQLETNGVNVDTDKMRETNLTGNISYKFSPNFSFCLVPRYEYSNLVNQERIQKRFALNSNMEWRTKQGTSLKLRSSFFDYKNYTLDKSSDWDDKTYEVDVYTNSLLFKKQYITVGYQLQYETINDRGKDYEANQTLHSIYFQDETTIGVVDLIVGARIDIHKLWGTEFNPKISTNLKLTNNMHLKASVGRSFRGPELVKLYGSWNMGPYLVKPNQDLEPESSLGIQAGFDWVISKKLQLNGSYFYNDIKNLISNVYDRNTRPWVLLWENIDKAVTKGIELQFAAALFSNLRTSVGMTFLNAEDKLTGEKLLNRPSYSGHIEVNYFIPKIQLNCNATALIYGKRYIEAEGVSTTSSDMLSPFTTVNLALSKRIGFVNVFLRIINLFNQENIVDQYDLIGTRIMGGFRLSFE